MHPMNYGTPKAYNSVVLLYSKPGGHHRKEFHHICVIPKGSRVTLRSPSPPRCQANANPLCL